VNVLLGLGSAGLPFFIVDGMVLSLRSDNPALFVIRVVNPVQFRSTAGGKDDGSGSSVGVSGGRTIWLLRRDYSLRIGFVVKNGNGRVELSLLWFFMGGRRGLLHLWLRGEIAGDLLNHVVLP